MPKTIDIRSMFETKHLSIAFAAAVLPARRPPCSSAGSPLQVRTTSTGPALPFPWGDPAAQLLFSDFWV